MGLIELQQRLRRAAPRFAEIVQPCYFAASHAFLTRSGMKIPTEKDIEEVVISLVDSLKEDDDAASSAGCQIEIERDDDGNILDGSIGYICTLDSLLGEEDVEE